MSSNTTLSSGESAMMVRRSISRYESSLIPPNEEVQLRGIARYALRKQPKSTNWKPNKLGNACNSIKRGTNRFPSAQIAKSTTWKFGCADSLGTSKSFGTAKAECLTNSGVRVAATISFAARVTTLVNSRVRKIGVSEIRKSAGHFSDSFTQRTEAAYFSGVKLALKAERSFGST